MKYVGTISLAHWPKRAILGILELMDLHEQYLGWEIGNTGYEHCQFAIDCASDLRELSEKHNLGWHIEDCISWPDAIDYCRKSGHYSYIGDSREEREYRRIARRGTLPIHDLINRHIANQNDRQISVCIDRKGSAGKSTMGYLADRRGEWFTVPRLETEPRRANDYIAKHYQNEEVIWIDLPRNRAIDEDLAILLEDIKDGLIASGKYQGCKARTRGAKVLVTTNQWIPHEAWEQLTEDRWDTFGIRINGEMWG